MSKPIRILHVLGCLDYGGAETMVMNWYRNVDRNKVQFDFIIHTTDKCDYTDEILKLGGKIYSISRFEFKNSIKYFKEWNQFFKNYPEYKIIHGHVRSTAAIYLKIAKKAGLYTIVHSHSNSSGKGIEGLIKNILQFPIRYIADYFFACSLSAGKWLFGKKICASEHFEVLNNAINTELFKYNPEVRKQLKYKMGLNNYFVIGNIGRFHPSKNHEFMLDVFSEICKKQNNVKMLLVGDGELFPQIKEKAKKMGINENIIFTGTREDTHDLLQVMDVFIFPSIYEGFGMALVEAQASGLQCVVADTIQKEALITNLIKIVSLKNSKREWADIILSYKNKCRHQYTQSEIVKAGFDIKNISKKMETFYLEKIKEYS